MSKKIISIILSLVLVLGMCCISAFAEAGDNALLGDVDSDREVTVKDATLLQLYLAKFKGDSDIDLSVADYSQDGYINVLDVTYIQLYIANLLPQNPVDDIACPVTIYFNSQTKEIAVSAENLTNFEFEYITAVGGGSDSFLNGANWVVDAQYASSFKLTKVVAVGGGSGTWLNGESWSVNSTKNIMTDEDGDGVYEITYTGVTAGTKQFRLYNKCWGNK